MTTPARKRLILRLRRRVRVQRRFDVADLGDGREKQTCRDCGWSIVVNHAERGADIAVVSKLIRYRTQGGITGICRQCSKRAAEERYPL